MCSNPYIFKYKSYCIPSDFLEHIQSVNNTLIIVNSKLSTVKTGNWLSFKQWRILNFFIFLAYLMPSKHLTLKTSLRKVENLLFKSGSEYEISNIIISYLFDVADIPTVNFLVFYGGNRWLNDCIVENTLFYLYNINFSALRGKLLKIYVNLLINKTCIYKTPCPIDLFFHI